MANDSLRSLSDWIEKSPTPFHVVATVEQHLSSCGFTEVHNFTEEFPTKGFIKVDGSIVIWQLGSEQGAYRIIGAHTDSPNLRIQPRPDYSSAGFSQLGIEIYGGVLLNSWLDRDLGIAGRVVTSDGEVALFNIAEPLARIPQLAIHLDREINERGLLLDKHVHMNPIWGTQSPSFIDWLSSQVGKTNIAAFDAHLFDLTSPSLLGVDRTLFASARLDNQLSCWAGVQALTSAKDSSHTQIVILNDHEEVGSASTTGAAGPLLSQVINIIDQQFGRTSGSVAQARRESWCLSADNAHAVHPNYSERHDPRHGPVPNLGPAVKLNGNQRYATSARGAAHIRNIADTVNAPLQTFVSKNNMPCGSTIGPITATQLGIEAIDIGVPQLSMHSAREVCGVNDPDILLTIMQAFLEN